MPAHDRSHYAWPYQLRAAAVRRSANANPAHLCWRCGRTLAQHPPHKDGRRPRWQAGHTVDGDSSAPLAAEASTCNLSEGAKAGNVKRALPTSRRWY